MKTKYDIYLRTEGRKKTYLVGLDCNKHSLIEEAKRYFHVDDVRIICTNGWTYRRNLYLYDPKIDRANTCWVAFLK